MDKKLSIEPIDLHELEDINGGITINFKGCLITNGKCTEGGCGITNGNCFLKPTDPFKPLPGVPLPENPIGPTTSTIS